MNEPQVEPDEGLQQFQSILSAWKGCYRRAIISYVAVRHKESDLLLAGRVVFDSEVQPFPVEPFFLESLPIIAERRILSLTSAQDFDTIVTDVEAGSISLDGKILRMPESTGSPPFWTAIYPIYHPSISVGPRLPSLVVRGGSKDNLLNKRWFKPYEFFDWSLQAADQPFDSLNELLLHLGLPGAMQVGETTILELLLTTPAIISSDSTIAANRASITVKVARGLAHDKIRLGYRVHHSASIERGVLCGADFQWNHQMNLSIGSTTIDVRDAHVLLAFLSYADLALHQWWIDDPKKRLNPRYAISEVFDPEHRLMERFLFAVEKDSRTFEHGVALLLHTLGFAISHHGTITKLEQGPDLIAITPLGNIGVIECTTGLLDQDDKLAKLVQRTRTIRSKLQESGFGHLAIQSVIVTQLPRKGVEAHIEQAGKLGIAVVCREELESLLKSNLRLPQDADRLFQRAVESVPRPDQQGLFGHSS